MRRFSAAPALLLTLLLGAWFVPFACALSVFAWVFFGIPENSAIRIGRTALLAYLGILVMITTPAVVVGVQSLWRKRRGAAHIEVLAAGLTAGDYTLIRQLFPHSEEIRLTPITGGYSGAAVFQARSWGVRAALQRASIVKVGSTAKLQPEVDNYDQYVREYVGNTATLMQVVRRGNRMALRWSYAAFTGDSVQTLAEYAQTSTSLVPVIDELFASQSTMGLLLGTPRRDPQCALYREYSWTPRDWQRIVHAADEVLEKTPFQANLPFTVTDVADGETSRLYPNPLPIMLRWNDPEAATGERTTQLFDVPIVPVHGDLNSRNILIDQRGAVFVIDFASTGPGHLLRDFARLETELLLVVNQPTDSAAVADLAQKFETLLRNPNDTPRTTLRDLLQLPPMTDRWLQAVVAIRRQAHDLAGPWLNGPAAPYLIALLHTTLDTLRYSQCGPYTKRAALLIAGRLCQELE